MLSVHIPLWNKKRLRLEESIYEIQSIEKPVPEALYIQLDLRTKAFIDLSNQIKSYVVHRIKDLDTLYGFEFNLLEDMHIEQDQEN